MNKIFVIGNLCADPEARVTRNGVNVCVFTIAVNPKHSSGKDGNEPLFYRINAWRQLGETCQKFLAKGKKVAVWGELQPRTYEKDGQTRISLDISADEVEFLSSKSENTMKQNSESTLSGFSEIDENTLPF